MDKRLIEHGIKNEFQKIRMSLSVLKHLSENTNDHKIEKLIKFLEDYFNDLDKNDKWKCLNIYLLAKVSSR